jgi:hypothetical protein
MRAWLLALGLAAANQRDWLRAKTKKPRAEYKGSTQTELSQVLNKHMLQTELHTRACDQWNTSALQNFMLQVLDRADPALDEHYQKQDDRRKLLHGSARGHEQHWRGVNGVVGGAEHLHKPVRDSHCRQAVMMWVHHLTDEARAELRPQVEVPLLPEEEKAECYSKTYDEHGVCVGAEVANSCDWCHSTQADADAGKPGTHAPDAHLPQYHGPDDGNPHGWDRKRRCDQDNKPGGPWGGPCQICEGVGGQCWSDKNEDCHIATCVPVSLPNQTNMSTVHWPLYPKQFTHSRYKDVLIGRKTDPFCFAFFPENNSSGTECYRAEDGVKKWYDIDKEAVRTDYNIKMTGAFGIFSNITSTVTHVGKYMWIINHLWLGMDQCICTDPGRTHCTTAPNCSSYAWHWDFAKDAEYLGREVIGVEWVGEMELDHFILWSHHMWTDPKSGRIVRMWKPWNGLQIYDPHLEQESGFGWLDRVDDESVFDIPPAQCKKGGAKIRIKCDDNGNYHPDKNEGLEFLAQMQQGLLTPTDQVVV